MSPCPSPEWEVLLEPFRPLFTTPGYRYFCAFVRVLAHLDRRLWVTQVILAGLVDRHFTSFYRFLREGVWSLSAVRQQLWMLCRPRCQGAGACYFVAVDDTVCPKFGKRFFGLGWHHDPINRQHPRKLSHGHCFVCLAGLAQQTGEHFVALFIGCALYVQEKACKPGRAFVTKLVLAAQLVCELTLPPGQRLVVVVDGAYARRPFVQALWATGRHVVSRLRSDTVFYDLPPVRKKGKKGRPRQYGAKHKAREWAQTKQRWRRATLRLYGKEATLEWKSRVVIQRTLGVRIRLVAVRFEKRPLVFLFSTDTKLSAAEIVRVYGARFAIETGFRDSKQSFGLSTYQVRSEGSMERLVHLCLWAQTLLRLRCWEAEPQPIYGEWRKPLGYLTLSQQKRLSHEADSVLAGSHAGTRTDVNPTGLPMAA
jgi:hypothetical protein